MINKIRRYLINCNAIILFGGLFVISCSDETKELPTYEDNIDLTKDVAKNVIIILSQRAKAQTKISAPILVRNENVIPPFAEMTLGLEAQFFDDTGRVTTHLTAQYARYYERQQNVILQKNVVVTNSDSTVLKTEELIWNNQLELFYTDKPVHITRQGYVIMGTGLEANKDLTEVKITQQKSIIDVKDTSSVQSANGSDVAPNNDTTQRQSIPQTQGLVI